MYIKLFESFQAELEAEKILDRIFENEGDSIRELFLFEAEKNVDWDYEDERELTKGEKAALARGHQVMSEEQLAAMYLAAMGRVEDKDNLKYLKKVPGMMDFADINPKTQQPFLTMAAFADAIGLRSNVTMARTVKKFANLIEGTGETDAEVLYPKLVKAYEAFKKMNIDALANIAGETIQDESNTTNRDQVENQAQKSAESRKLAKQSVLKQGEAVYDIFKKLKPSFSKDADPTSKAMAMAIARISKETGKPQAEIKDAYKAYLEDKKILSSTTFK